MKKTKTDIIQHLKSPRQHKSYTDLKENIALGLDMYVHGPTGSGKTHAIAQISRELNTPFYKRIVGSSMPESSLMGYVMGHEYIEGIAFKPFTDGGVLLLDEVDNGNANTNLVINGLSDGELAFPCGMRNRSEDFVLIATANTLGQGPSLNYIGRNKQDVSLLNRFVFFFWPYDNQLTYDFCLDIIIRKDLVEKDNITIFNAHLEEFNKMIVDIQRIIQAIEELKIPHIISPRTVKQVAIKIVGDRTRTEILNTVILKGLSKEQKERIMEVFKKQKAIPEHLPKFESPIEDNEPPNSDTTDKSNSESNPQHTPNPVENEPKEEIFEPKIQKDKEKNKEEEDEEKELESKDNSKEQEEPTKEESQRAKELLDMIEKIKEATVKTEKPDFLEGFKGVQKITGLNSDESNNEVKF